MWTDCCRYHLGMDGAAWCGIDAWENDCDDPDDGGCAMRVMVVPRNTAEYSDEVFTSANFFPEVIANPYTESNEFKQPYFECCQPTDCCSFNKLNADNRKIFCDNFGSPIRGAPAVNKACPKAPWPCWFQEVDSTKKVKGLQVGSPYDANVERILLLGLECNY